jgi:Flp pilus assembly protein TadG
MITSTRSGDRRRQQRGQILPLFALFLIVLVGFTALAIDVSSALSAKRFYRSAADAAALAGAQDLQKGVTRAVTNNERTRARTDAMAQLVSLMGASSTPTCPPATNIVDCALPGTDYLVSIKTPSPSCVTCDPDRSVQVTVRNPVYGLSFARLFGQPSWNVGSTSVAGLTYGKTYTVVTLRPPKKVGSTFEVKDITLDGGTVVTVNVGDVGSNANMNYSGTGSLLVLDPDYDMFYFDPLSGPLWFPTPTGVKIQTLITDPNYQYPSMVSAPTFGDARESQANIAGKPVTTASIVGSSCEAEWAKVDKTRYAAVASTPVTNVYCYEPGIYDPAAGSGPENATITVSTGNVALLKPGAYYLKGGLDVGGSLIGGYEPAPAPGVALMFDECQNACIFKGQNAIVIALNAGTRFPATYTGGSPASAAIDWQGQPVLTSGASSPNPPILMTILVKKDPTCFVPTAAPFIEPAACDALKNKSIEIKGTGQLVLHGVQYVPTDNVEIGGNAGTTGRVGQIISWTLKYSGGVAINQEGASNDGVGILRLDAACTTPTTVCNGP